MIRRVLAGLLLPAMASAQGSVTSDRTPGNSVPVQQDVVVGTGGPIRVSSILSNAAEQPHALRAGRDTLVFRRDTLITTNLLVLGRPTYLASRVQGDVVVVGADLFLRPGSDVSGRAIAIGGTVSRTFLGRVHGTVESFRDDDYAISATANGYRLEYRGREPDPPPFFKPAGLSGLMTPSYDRVDGFSMPVGAVITVGKKVVELQPMATYRSRMGEVDPSVELRVTPDKSLRLEADVGRSTRTNDAWIYGNILNSLATIAFGNDSRNYFRSVGGTARLIGRIERANYEFEPFIGGRYERVSPITNGVNVWSIWERNSLLHMARPNPIVEKGKIGSYLAGGSFTYRADSVKGELSAEAEKSTQTPAGTSEFFQVTADGFIDFPTFRRQRLRVHAHGVATSGDAVPIARYAYVGRASTLPLLNLLQEGGDQLLFVENRYMAPLYWWVLPKVGAPTVYVRHLMGAAGKGSLPKLEQEIGTGLGLGLFRAEYVFDVSGNLGSIFSVGFSLRD